MWATRMLRPGRAKNMSIGLGRLLYMPCTLLTLLHVAAAATPSAAPPAPPPATTTGTATGSRLHQLHRLQQHPRAVLIAVVLGRAQHRLCLLVVDLVVDINVDLLTLQFLIIVKTTFYVAGNLVERCGIIPPPTPLEGGGCSGDTAVESFSPAGSCASRSPGATAWGEEDASCSTSAWPPPPSFPNSLAFTSSASSPFSIGRLYLLAIFVIARISKRVVVVVVFVVMSL